ncbi:crinkler family protein [Moniliophthora roreri MCA 2997]|uniref:Crinkler family protein n=1 Tax=Moniliophthora roreri (strain MCA 2997) TaxID=1381753 RepID=V2WPZ4_MONRO|nr:crinkler family protein [Moniliophthora roreri MCA 2997]
MSTVKLNVFVTNSQRLILGEKSDDSLDYGNLLERVRLQLRSQFLQLYLVPNGLIKLPDTIKIPDLKGTLLKDVCRRDAGAFVVPMGLSLRDMILNHSVNDPHFVAKEPIDDGQPVDEIVIAVFGNNFGMENVKLFKARPSDLLHLAGSDICSSGAEPRYKLLCYYLEQARLCITQLRQAQRQDRHINFLAILLEHYGAHITVFAATFTDVPNVEPLTSIPLHVHSSNHDAILAGERMICALRIALEKLFCYNHSYPNLPDRQANYPFRDFYPCDNGTRHYFVYDGMIDEDKRIFFAHLRDNPNVRLCVKFTHRYCEAAHQAATTAGFAPRLYAVERVYGWFMVVMEDVPAKFITLYSRTAPYMEGLPRIPLDDSIRESVLAIVKSLHSQEFVHGDVRDVNLLIQKEQVAQNGTSPEVLIVDFDWAGPSGQARYPKNMNMTSVQRPPDAEPGGEIKLEHDLFKIR